MLLKVIGVCNSKATGAWCFPEGKPIQVNLLFTLQCDFKNNLHVLMLVGMKQNAGPPRKQISFIGTYTIYTNKRIYTILY